MSMLYKDLIYAFKEIAELENNKELLNEVNIELNNLNESIEKHDELNPDIWKDNKLRPEVREKLVEIASRFLDILEEDEVSLDVEDIIIVGSNASYNYNSTSDIDLHIIADLSEYDEYEDLAMKFLQAKKSLFNNKYDPLIRGHEVEIYVEQKDDTPME